jgi:hypothetical protein
MTTEINSKIKKRKTANDVFYTPIELVKIHLELLRQYIGENDLIYDPFFGTGNYYNTYKEYFPSNRFDFSEIELGKDFFNYNTNVDVIISNPPYSMIDAVFQKSVSLNPHTISYLIGQNNFTCRRIALMNEHGYFLDKVYFTKVFKWFGMSVICVFTKKSVRNCIEYDRTVWK